MWGDYPPFRHPFWTISDFFIPFSSTTICRFLSMWEFYFWLDLSGLPSSMDSKVALSNDPSMSRYMPKAYSLHSRACSTSQSNWWTVASVEPPILNLFAFPISSSWSPDYLSQTNGSILPSLSVERRLTWSFCKIEGLSSPLTLV